MREARQEMECFERIGMVRRMSDSILVSVGANLPGPGGRSALESCEWAVARVAAVPGLALMARSRWWRTAPVPPSGQPDYVNGALRLQGEADPAALLAMLHAIEAEGGRVRGAVNGARTLDLDLLGMDGLVRPGPGLVLPHPRLHERGFVLAPLNEVAPGWVHPLLGLRVAELARRADMTGVVLCDAT